MNDMRENNWIFRIFGLAIIALVILKCTACVGLPTLAVTPTTVVVTRPVPTATVFPTVTTLPSFLNVRIIGNVNLRDKTDYIVGWLAQGELVKAVCEGQWCWLSSGLRFWRGCSDNNPEFLGCQTR